jgi:peptidoglycan/LPS O-acetylase OafA/YrhL
METNGTNHMEVLSTNIPANDSPSGSGSVPATSKHLLFLDGLRGLAALFVTIHHMWLQLWPQTYHLLPTGPMLFATGWLGYGHFGVTIFIVLSGFSLALAAAKRGPLTRVDNKSFYMRRARRILPPYYLALVVSFLLAVTIAGKTTGTHWDVSLPVTLPGVLSHLFMMQDLFYVSQINHTFWSVALEWKLYFLFPLLVAACYKFGPLKTAAVATVLGYAGVVLLHGTPYNDFPIHFVGLFAMGIAAALLVFSRRPDWRRLSQAPAVTWTCVASAFILLAVSWTHYLRGLFYIDVFVGLITVAALMRMSLGRWPLLRKALESRPLAFVGTFSYSLYLIHAPLIQLVWQYLVHPLGFSRNAEFLLLFLIGTPLILACSYVFYLGCERPFLPSQSRVPKNAQPAAASMLPATLLGDLK